MSSQRSPRFSVILTAYSPDRFEDTNEAIKSIITGSYDNWEIIVVVDGRKQLADRLQDEWERTDNVKVICNDKNLGAAKSRNKAVDLATGDVVAFFDDDAVADKEWLSELARAYTEHDAVAAGGRIDPIWLTGKPKFLPEEFYWLIGATYKGYPKEMTYVRNTFASNLSLRRSVFLELGGFNPNIGPKGESLLQSAETDLCTRLYIQTGNKVLYNPEAIVGHRVYQYRTEPTFLLKRAFYQGVSKRGMQLYTQTELDSESNFLKGLLIQSIPEKIQKIMSGKYKQGLLKAIFLILGIASVGFGYIWGSIRFRNKIQY